MQLYPPEHYDDKANGYRHIRTRPLAAAMGAEIQGVNLADLDDAAFEEIKAALFRYKMIYFRRQQLSLSDQENLTLRFGAFGTDAYTKGVPGHPNVQRLIKEAETRIEWIFGEGWHSDSPFLERPPAITLLYGKDIPPWGGDTWWSNTELAYRYLSDTMKGLVAKLRAHRSAAVVLRNILSSNGAFEVGEIEMNMQQKAMVRGAYHPIVRTHPDTGAKALYIDQAYSLGIEGLTEAEARPLLDFLGRHVIKEEFCCRLTWEPDTLVIWDNRQCVHKAFNDYDGFRREMFRTIVDGEAPF